MWVIKIEGVENGRCLCENIELHYNAEIETLTFINGSFLLVNMDVDAEFTKLLLVKSLLSAKREGRDWTVPGVGIGTGRLGGKCETEHIN